MFHSLSLMRILTSETEVKEQIRANVKEQTCDCISLMSFIFFHLIFQSLVSPFLLQTENIWVCRKERNIRHQRFSFYFQVFTSGCDTQVPVSVGKSARLALSEQWSRMASCVASFGSGHFVKVRWVVVEQRHLNRQ